MNADTQAQGDLVRMIEKHCDFIRVDSVTQEVRHYLFTPAQIEILAAALQGREGEPSECRWTYEDDPTFAWNTGCGNMFSFIDGNPKENDFKFCCYCGGPLVQEQT